MALNSVSSCLCFSSDCKCALSHLAFTFLIIVYFILLSQNTQDNVQEEKSVLVPSFIHAVDLWWGRNIDGRMQWRKAVHPKAARKQRVRKRLGPFLGPTPRDQLLQSGPTPKRIHHFSIRPSDYACVSGLTHGWGQSLHDLVPFQKLQLWIVRHWGIKS